MCEKSAFHMDKSSHTFEAMIMPATRRSNFTKRELHTTFLFKKRERVQKADLSHFGRSHTHVDSLQV